MNSLLPILTKDKTGRLVFFIFFLSGISGLIYETVWLRMLSRVLGSTVYATSIVLSAFMLGLTLGSYYIGKKVDKVRSPIRLYALLELGIAASALLVFFLLNGLIPTYRFFHAISGEQHVVYRLLQSLTVFILLVVPTFLMGGTLPVLSAEAKKRSALLAGGVSKLYGINTLGAVIGVIFSGFFAIGFLGEFNTVLVSSTINLLIGAFALFFIGKHQIYDSEIPKTSDAHTQEALPSKTFTHSEKTAVLLTYSLIGFTAFAIELVWTRLFQIQLGTSIYAFSMVLCVYLLGSATGSLTGGKYFKKMKDPMGTLSLSLGFIALYSIAGIFIFCQHIPVEGALSYGFSSIYIPLLVVFPITFSVGLIFPIVTKIYVEQIENLGGGVGRLYAMNTFGCILGSLIGGYILIPYLGTRNTILFLALLNFGAALFLLLKSTLFEKRKFNWIILLMIGGFGIIMSLNSPDPFFTVIKEIVLKDPDKEIFYHKEGVAATTTSFGSKKDPLDRQILINGIGMTALVPETKIMSHLPILLHKDPHDMLVICFGMGTALRSAITHTEITCDVVELVAEEYETFKYYHKDAGAVLSNKRVHPFVDDGRNFLLMREKKYDVIVLDPAPPLWSAGTVNLYTVNFFDLCRKRLNTHGIMCLWIPPDSKTEIKMIMRSFYEIFPKTIVFGGPSYPGFFLLGSDSDLEADPARFASADRDSLIMHDLNEWSHLFNSSIGLLDLQIMTAAQLWDNVKDSPVITDNFPYTEFPLWRSKFVPDYTVFYNAGMFQKRHSK
ncbi:MAG: fused MFS/spermidine synthase [bacterium]|nr:fused MFS/spermidine synthase [bacterium]